MQSDQLQSCFSFREQWWARVYACMVSKLVVEKPAKPPCIGTVSITKYSYNAKQTSVAGADPGGSGEVKDPPQESY